MKTRLFLSLIFMFFFLSCKKDNEKVKNDSLIGSWKWVQSNLSPLANGIPGTLQNSPQYAHKLVYTNEGRVMKYDKDNKLVFDYDYSIIKAISVMDNKEHNMIASSSFVNTLYTIRNDSLILCKDSWDEGSVIYLRK